MRKRRNQPLIDSDSNTNNETTFDLDSKKLLSSTKKKKNPVNVRANHQRRQMTASDSDSDWSEKVGETDQSRPKSQNPSNFNGKSELEEGQVSSDESSDSSDSEFNDGYDEKLMGDEEDQTRLQALSEKERETEIFKRSERRDALRRRWEIEQKLRQAQRGECDKDKSTLPKDKKKKIEAKYKRREQEVQARTIITERTIASLIPAIKTIPINEEPKVRSKERQKNVEMNKTDNKRSNAMAELKAKREGKQRRDEEEEAKRRAGRERNENLDSGVAGGKSSTKLKASDIYSDDSGSDSDDKPSGNRSSISSRSSSDSEEAGATKIVAAKKPVFIATKEELNELRISRHKMEKFLTLPLFDRLVTNRFVRAPIEKNNFNKQPVYECAEIIGVVETAKIYLLGKHRTNKGLRLRHGSTDRVLRLEFISNQDFTDSEFQKWKLVCQNENIEMPTVELVANKLQEMKDASVYEFKEDVVQKMVEEKNRFRKHPTNYAMKKTCLMKEQYAAVLCGEDDLARKLTTEIEELEERANQLDKKRSNSISCISYINDRNRKQNVEKAEKAIKEEIKANKGLKINDPFTRRSTKPTMKFKQRSAEEEAQLMQLIPTVLSHSGKKEDDKKKQLESTDNNLYAWHDFEIDLDVKMTNTPAHVLPKPIISNLSEAAPKRSLTLEDYKKKRGLV